MTRTIVALAAALGIATAAIAASPDLVSRYEAAGQVLAAQQCPNAQCVEGIRSRNAPQSELQGVSCFLDALDKREGDGAGKAYVERLESLARAVSGTGRPPAPPTDADVQHWKDALASCGLGKKEG